MSEGTLFTPVLRWQSPPSLAAGSLPVGGARAAVDDLGPASADGSDSTAAALEHAAVLRQQQLSKHLHSAAGTAHLSRTQSEVAAPLDHAEHFRRQQAHWSDSGLGRGLPEAAQHRPSWPAFFDSAVGGGSRSGAAAAQARRYSLDSVQELGAGRGRARPPYRPADRVSPNGGGGSRAFADRAEYAAQRPDAAAAAAAAATPAYCLTAATAAGLDSSGGQSSGLPMQQWNFPLPASAAAAAAAAAPTHPSQMNVNVVAPAPSWLMLQSQPPVAGPPVAMRGCGIDDAGASAKGMFWPLPGAELSVEEFAARERELQRGGLEKLALEVHRQETYLRWLLGTADQLSHALEQLRGSKIQAAASLRSSNGGGQPLPSGRAKELVVKLRLDNSHLLANIEDLERELSSVRHGNVQVSLIQGEAAERFGIGGRGHRPDCTAPAASSEGVEQAKCRADTWPEICMAGAAGPDTRRESFSQQRPDTRRESFSQQRPDTRRESFSQQQPRRFDAEAAASSSASSSSGASGNARAPDEGDAAGWNCDMCTFLNHAMLNMCEICEAPRMTGRAVARAAACCHQTGCYCHVGAARGSGHV